MKLGNCPGCGSPIFGMYKEGVLVIEYSCDCDTGGVRADHEVEVEVPYLKGDIDYSIIEE